MNEVAPDVWQLTGFPTHQLNAYLIEDVLIDAATRWRRWGLLADLRSRPLSLVALTHCHPDHQGSAAAICDRRHVPLACHEADAASVEGRHPMLPDTLELRLGARFWAGPPHAVQRLLREGDVIAGFRVIHAPGHTPGHIIFYRDADGVAIAGDLLNNIHSATGAVRLEEPPTRYCVDPDQNRCSIRRLRDLRPRLICFGHGPPLRDLPTLERFVDGLPQ